jgi:hypothetical protein
VQILRDEFVSIMRPPPRHGKLEYRLFAIRRGDATAGRVMRASCDAPVRLASSIETHPLDAIA